MDHAERFSRRKQNAVCALLRCAGAAHAEAKRITLRFLLLAGSKSLLLRQRMRMKDRAHRYRAGCIVERQRNAGSLSAVFARFHRRKASFLSKTPSLTPKIVLRCAVRSQSGHTGAFCCHKGTLYRFAAALIGIYAGASAFCCRPAVLHSVF